MTKDIQEEAKKIVDYATKHFGGGFNRQIFVEVYMNRVLTNAIEELTEAVNMLDLPRKEQKKQRGRPPKEKK